MLFPKKDDLDDIERVALSFILSLAVVPLLGLILNFTPFDIRLIPVLVILSVFTISILIIAWFRRMKLPAEERFRVPFGNLLKFNLGQNVLDKGLSIFLISAIMVSFATLFYVVVTPKIGERFTEFYLLDQNGTTSDYPTDLIVGEEGKIMICIVNHEHENITYSLKVVFNGSLIIKEKVFLNNNEKWEKLFLFKARKKGENQKLKFLLFKDQKTEAYRTLHLWIRII